MLLNKAYYALKPVIPWRVRTALRRWRGNRRRTAFADVWPIDEKAGATPPAWPGWPEGKRFALVLTHDVEWTKGLERVERVIDLESRYSFRSSFNFVPEREYRVSDSLRQMLEHSGFEVGVHGFKHDGKLYSSKREFASRATHIREYLHKWNASGFRSPLMQHNLQWLHLLGAEYDASTFDTDPFEPEPDGVRTIFPFWVPGPEGSGYVELPYTLVQDFTLFVVLREQNIDIWKRKLDWIVAHGGMALLNTHPDYMCFDGKRDRDEFPAAYYEEFLRYISEKYDGSFWHPLPRDVARFFTTCIPRASRNSRKKICMLTYSNYETDTRVRQYAEALAKRSDEVDVIAITQDDRVPRDGQEVAGVNLFRIQRRKHNESGKWMYAWRLLCFFLKSALLVARRHDRVRYDLIHVHNIPDFLVYAAFYPKWRGAKVILDIHDIVPELFANKFETNGRGLYVRLLKRIERSSASFADHVIVANHLWQQRLISRSVPKQKCSVILNHVDRAIFYRRTRTRNDQKFILLFPGTWQWHQGLDIAVKALGHLKDDMPDAELHLYGGGGGSGTKARLAKLADELHLDGRVKFFGDVSLDQVANVMANADVGVVPKRADSFGNEAYSTKIVEFMSQGLPVVASRTKIDSFYFDDSLVRFFPSGNSRAMADAILDIKKNSALRESLVEAGLEYASSNDWDHSSCRYLDLVDTLTTEIFEGAQSISEVEVDLFA